ncbi:MAG: monofunctional biosynthetic peptidoglycan transglycosylase [Gammaproteobacteria bacterium]|nr:monofunctional biosynthetic peptidoglycan transglycosylase [Gammaproteobacteria bacterium]
MNGRRIVRWLLQTLLAAVAASVLAVLLLRFVPPLTSAFMIENRLASLAAGDFGRANDYDWVPLEEISPHAAIAVIASEDQLFPFHAGFDFDSIRQAIRYNAKGRKTRGASTISQQASRKFFGKSAARLTRREAATLAAVLPSPARMRAATPSAYVQRRSEFIMGQMRALGGESYLKQLDDEEPKRKP